LATTTEGAATRGAAVAGGTGASTEAPWGSGCAAGAAVATASAPPRGRQASAPWAGWASGEQPDTAATRASSDAASARLAELRPRCVVKPPPACGWVTFPLDY